MLLPLLALIYQTTRLLPALGLLAGVPECEAVEEMAMANPVRPPPRKFVDRLLHVVPAPLDQVADEKVACAVEPVVAVNAHHVVVSPSGLGGGSLFLILPDLVYQLDEVGNVLAMH